MKKLTYLILIFLFAEFFQVSAQIPTTQVLPDTSKMTYDYLEGIFAGIKYTVEKLRLKK